MQGLDAAIAAVRGELKELLGMIRSQEEGLQDFKEVSAREGQGLGPAQTSR